MRIFKQLGFVLIIIALVILFQKYPTLGIILAILWFSKRFFKSKRKSSGATVRELREINKNLDALTTILTQLIGSSLATVSEKKPVDYSRMAEFGTSFQEDDRSIADSLN